MKNQKQGKPEWMADDSFTSFTDGIERYDYTANDIRIRISKGPMEWRVTCRPLAIIDQTLIGKSFKEAKRDAIGVIKLFIKNRIASDKKLLKLL